MTKFCKYCGKELEKGKTCSCQKDIKKTNKKEQKELEKAKETLKTEMSNSAQHYAKEVLEIWKGIFKNAKKTTEEFIEKDDHILTSIFMILTCLLISFCTVSFLKGIYTATINPLTSFDSAYNRTAFNQVWNFSYFKILCCIFIGLFLGKLLLAIIFSLGFEKINQKKISWGKTLTTIEISLLEPVTMIVLSAFLTIFSYKLSFLIVIYAILLFIINIYQNFKLTGKVESNNYNRLFAILIIIFIFLSIYLIPNLFI